MSISDRHYHPNSSQIASHAYDPDARELHVKFHSGGDYVYSGVEPEHHDGMKGAESAGSYLAKHIKGKYAHRRS